jgi:predicted nucleotidyltransferase
MDVARPASVVMAPGTAAVLHALAGTTRPVGIRELGRIAGVSPNRAHQVIRTLAEHGLVTVEDHAALRLCQLNRTHLLAEPVMALVDLRRRLFEFLTEEISSWEAHPLHASVFGSAARGDGDTSSDIDLLVICRDDVDEETWDEQLYESGRRIYAATGNEPAWFSITTSDLARAVETDEPVVRDWQRDAVHLVGQRLTTLLRQVA